MAANPLIVTFAKQVAHVDISWTGWALASIVPGLVSLIIIPYFIFKVYPPEVKETPEAQELARQKLKEMGPLKTSEKIMLGVFVLILVLWIFGTQLKLVDTTVALIGLSLLLLTQVLTFDDVKKEQGAWDTLTWFAALVMMAGFLNTLGLVPWFSHLMQHSIGGMGWVPALLILLLVYFFVHYFFASQTAHITAMYSAFLAVAVAVGAPPMLAALTLAFFSNLFASTTHYGSGPAPVFFGANYVPQKNWWSIGFAVAILNIAIWLGVSGLWWKVLGLW